MTEPRRPVFWYQGLFLQPQHFQHADLFTQSLLAPLRRYLQPYFWGVCRLWVNETALSGGNLRFGRGRVHLSGWYLGLAGRKWQGKAQVVQRSGCAGRPPHGLSGPPQVERRPSERCLSDRARPALGHGLPIRVAVRRPMSRPTFISRVPPHN